MASSTTKSLNNFCSQGGYLRKRRQVGTQITGQFDNAKKSKTTTRQIQNADNSRIRPVTR